MYVARGEAGENWTYLGNGGVQLVKPADRTVAHTGVNLGALRELTFTPVSPVDISAYSTLEWTMMVATDGTTDVFEEVAEAYMDTAKVTVSDATHSVNFLLNKWQVGEESADHYRDFAIDLTASDLDLTTISSITFVTIPYGQAAVQGTPHAFVRVDKIIATNNAVTPSGYGPEEFLIITDCEAFTGWSQENTNPGLRLDAGQGVSGNSVVATGSTGALRKITFTPDSPLDLTAFKALEWDQMTVSSASTYDYFDQIVAAYADTMMVELRDGTKSVRLGPDQWKVGVPAGFSGKNRYRHMAISLEGLGLNLANITSISFATLPQGEGEPVDGTSTTVFRFDNLIATEHEIVIGGPEVDPEGVWSIHGSTDRTASGSFSFEINDFNHNLSGYEPSQLYLTMKVYVENKSNPGNVSNFGTGGQIELASSGAQNMYWSLSKLALKAGWNNVRVRFDIADGNNGLNLANINYFRFYAVNGDASTYAVKIKDVKIVAPKEQADVVSTFFADGMMFQRNKPMNVFGTLDSAAQQVKVELIKDAAVLDTKTATAMADGSWKVTFDGREGGYDPYTIKIYVGGALKKTINNILIGELWLTAGQSNMEYYVISAMPTLNAPIPTNQYVRFFVEPTVPGGTGATLSAYPATDMPESYWSDGSIGDNAKYVSAIGYFMSLKLQEELNVPVGFIHAAKGASLIESWLPRASIENNALLKSTLEAGDLYFDEDKLGTRPGNWERLTTLYNAKIAPMAGINIAGMLWYHGESNVKYANSDGDNEFYALALQELVKTYSADFGFENGDMPFVFAHLAPHDYSTATGRANDYQMILAQFSEMLSETAATIDARMMQIPLYDLSLQYNEPPFVNPDPIHPNSKIALGERFADAVLAGVYNVGDSDAQTAPTVKSFAVEGDKVILTFANAGSGLKILNEANSLSGFAIAGRDRVFVKADAKIVAPDKVELTSESVASPVAATYAWTSFNMASNLANSLGIPAVPYRSDKVASTYYVSMDWADFDSDQVWINLTTLDAGFKPAYTTSDNAAVSVETEDKLDGKAAISLDYTLSAEGTAELAPVLDYHGMLNQYGAYTGMTVYAKNPDSRAKQLSVKLTSAGEDYYAAIVDGDTLSTSYTLSGGAFTECTFNFARLVNVDGKVLSDSKPVLNMLSALTIVLTDSESGSILLDKAFMRTDKLPTPGSENDDVLVIEDTTPGSVDADGNMWLNSAETTMGWSVNGGELVIDTEKYTQGSSSVGTTAAGGNLRQIAYTPGKGLDISQYQYLEFDAYFSNLDWFGATDDMMFELTSSGGPDNESHRYTKTSMLTYSSDLQAEIDKGSNGGKWFHFKLNLDSPHTKIRGGLDKQNFNFFRFYAINSPAGTPDFDVRFDNMKFTKSADGTAGGADPSYGKVIDATSMWLTDAEVLGYWRANGTEPARSPKNKTQGSSSIMATAKGGNLRQLAFVPDRAIDISDYQFLEFDVYFDNLAWFGATNDMMFELTSSGDSDNESHRYTKSSILEASPTFAADIESGATGGKWYHFKFNLDTPHAKVRGGLNKQNFNFFRFYSINAAAGTPDYTIYLDNMKFVKGEKAQIVKTDKYMVISSGDSASGWSSPGQEVMVDTANKTEGKGSVTVTAKGGVLKELVYRPSEPIDLTGYGYLQFDLFLSDITTLNTSTGFMIEMTSSGTCDDQSNRWQRSGILASCPELANDLNSGSKGNKWYHFCMNIERPQSQARGGLDITKFDYFRVYFIGSPAGTPDCVVKLDNMRVTTEGIPSPTATGGGQTIIFPSSGSTGKNIGNKVNNGLLAPEQTPAPTALITAAIAAGGVLIVLILVGGILLAVLGKRKKD